MEITAVHDGGLLYAATLATGEILWVPKDAENADYMRIQQWIAEGGTLS